MCYSMIATRFSNIKILMRYGHWLRMWIYKDILKSISIADDYPWWVTAENNRVYWSMNILFNCKLKITRTDTEKVKHVDEETLKVEILVPSPSLIYSSRNQFALLFSFRNRSQMHLAHCWHSIRRQDGVHLSGHTRAEGRAWSSYSPSHTSKDILHITNAAYSA